MNNVSFQYRYRDGSNFKKLSEVIFRDPDALQLDQVTKSLEAAFEKDGLFIAHEIRIPEVFLYGKFDANADDHCYHEFLTVERTAEPPDDRHDRSIREFISEVQGAGWPPFDPFDRWLLAGAPGTGTPPETPKPPRSL